MQNPAAEYGAIRINRIRLSDYRFFHGVFELPIIGANILVYGENGSGKSSIYRALEYLTGKSFGHIATEKNIFSKENEPQIEFSFTKANGKN